MNEQKREDWDTNQLVDYKEIKKLSEKPDEVSSPPTPGAKARDRQADADIVLRVCDPVYYNYRYVSINLLLPRWLKLLRQPATSTSELTGLSLAVTDVREPNDFEEGHIPGALNLPASSFEQDLGRDEGK